MARMHSRKKGKSKSSKPIGAAPSWVSYKPEEVEKLVLKHKKTGMSQSEIGIILRDKFGIGDVKAVTGKRIAKILTENEVIGEIPEDMLNLIRRMVALRSHLDKNKKDMTAKRGLQLTDSKIRRLTKYYKGTKKLAPEWKLNRNRLKMYLE